MIFTVMMMRYSNIVSGRFVSRPNRFIANVQIDGQTKVCHVKNTGRCKELLVPGAEVFLERSGNPDRKTEFDLVAVRKGERMINMDSQAPNKAVLEWLKSAKPFGEDMLPYPESVYGGSRFDFMLKSENSDKKIYLEVKGCTLERDGAALFPDAPTERGVKHLRELIRCREEGLGAAVMILVQMEGVKYFSPNYATHREFGEVMRLARQKGVTLLCYDSKVTPDSLTVNEPVEIRL